MSGDRQLERRSSDQLRPLVTSALQGADRAVAFTLAAPGAHARKCPRRFRPKSEVLLPKVKPKAAPLPWYQKLAFGLAQFGLWLMGPLDFLGDALEALVRRIFRGIRWIFRTPQKRRRMTQLKGGWKSVAGGLNASMCITGDKVLVVGERLLALVYVGDHESEIGWQQPLTDVAEVEVATWSRADDRGATLRWHFRDGSWVDVLANGPEWKALTDAAA